MALQNVRPCTFDSNPPKKLDLGVIWAQALEHGFHSTEVETPTQIRT